MNPIRFNQFLSGRSVGKTMHGAVSIAFIGALFTGAALIAGSELPDLGGGSTSFALSVNDKGDVVGRSFNTSFVEHATVWLAGGLPTDLGSLGGKSSAKAVSSTGIIVGSSDLVDYSQHAALWSSAASAPIDLGTLGGYNSAASGVNANGDAVGLSHVPTSVTMHATLWPAATHAAVDINPSGAAFSEAVAINAGGDIVGTSMDATWVSQAVLWTGPSHTPVVLQTLGGPQGHAFAINDNGDIVGQTLNSSNVWRPTLWAAPAHAPADLGTPVVGSFGAANGINAVGDVVGYTGTADGLSNHATLWQMTSAAGSPSTCKLLTASRAQGRSRSEDHSSSDERRRAEERERDRRWLGLAPSSSAPSTAAPSTPAATSLAPSSSTGSRTMTDLGVLAGLNSKATSINASGKIVGYGDNATRTSRAMSWQAPAATLPPTVPPARDHDGKHENRGLEEGDC